MLVGGPLLWPLDLWEAPAVLDARLKKEAVLGEFPPSPLGCASFFGSSVKLIRFSAECVRAISGPSLTISPFGTLDLGAAVRRRRRLETSMKTSDSSMISLLFNQYLNKLLRSFCQRRINLLSNEFFNDILERDNPLSTLFIAWKFRHKYHM